MRATTFAAILTLVLAACSSPGGGGGAGFVPGPGEDSIGGGNPPGGFGGNCQATCEGRACGDDNCGGSCGGCTTGMVCASYSCYAPNEVPADATLTPEPEKDAGSTEVDTGTGPTDPSKDTDGDQIWDVNDNCKDVQNPGQEDFDQDGVGDACDDSDADGLMDDEDCAPTNPEINKMAKEKCNGLDDNCNGMVDEGAEDSCTNYYEDKDGDGTGVTSTGVCMCAPDAVHTAAAGGDCDDNDPTVSPWAAEKCDNQDNNCNMLVDEGCDDDGDGYCDAEMALEVPGGGNPSTCSKGGGDCFDFSPLIHPGAPELFGDGFDNNCDGQIDEMAQCSGPCTGKTVEAYLCSMEMCFGSLIESSKFSSPTGDDISSAWQAVNRFGSNNNHLAPFAGDSYALLATGPATGTFHSQDLPGFGSTTDPYSKDGYATHDNVEFTIVMTAPSNALGFSLDYIFFSEEYEEYIGTTFNDKFYIFLTGATTTGGKKEIINFTDCSNPNSYYDFVDGAGKKRCYIAINTAFSEPCTNPKTNISGTGYECGSPDSSHGSSTGWLTTSWPIEGGEKFTITFHIHDTSDGIYDSEVILDNFRFETEPFDPGTGTHK